MTTRNIAWLVTIVVVGLVAGFALGPVWGVVAALVVLVVSEVVERSRRRRRRGDAPAAPTIRGVVQRRRTRR